VGDGVAPWHNNEPDRVVSEGTLDLSVKTFNHTGLLPHECGVPASKVVDFLNALDDHDDVHRVYVAMK
jgi:transcriptional/translational regulatory protein YebC/TACO1